MSEDIFAANRAESEERLVACISSNPERIAEVAHIVDGAEFTNQFFGKWFELAVELDKAGTFTQDRLRTQLRKAGYLKDSSESSTFATLCREPISGSDALWHAGELARIIAIRKLQRALYVATVALDDIAANPEGLIASTVAKLEAISTRQGDLWEDIGKVAERVMGMHKSAMLEGTKPGISTGYPSIDEITGGYFPGQLWHIAARSYMGKSTVALELAACQVELNRGVYFASYEMENNELIERMFASRTGVHLEKFTKGGIDRDELNAVVGATAQFQGLPMFMDDRPPSTVQQLRARVKLAAAYHPITLVIVDHLGLFPHIDRRVPRHQQLLEITKELKTIAKELGVTVLILNQLNADADGEEPTDKHYAESKGIIANLDVSILLHRASKSDQLMKCIATKNRKGAQATCELLFEGEVQRVRDPKKGQPWIG